MRKFHSSWGFWSRHWLAARRCVGCVDPITSAMGVATGPRSSRRQAAIVAATARDRLLKEGGLVTTSLDSGEQWDAPNGWAPLQWIGVSGLKHYGHKQLAEVIACRWLLGVRRVYAGSAKLVEKYDMTNSQRAGGGGEYPLQDGFGWINGVTRKLMAPYPADAVSDRCQLTKSSAR